MQVLLLQPPGGAMENNNNAGSLERSRNQSRQRGQADAPPERPRRRPLGEDAPTPKRCVQIKIGKRDLKKKV